MMNKKSTSGGGHSSLGYLFGSDESEKQQKDQSKKSSPPVCMPPYGTDNFEDKPLKKASTPTTKKDDSTSLKNYVYHGDGDKSTGFLVTGRPSTKVTSVPGGDSSLGYLFGDK
ncbi:SPIRAL1-like5 [Artemisia annua]|uniref:SPIRAL1-like5 n=1 Tax=Artemisia annua TaxID=35608 RepID=A0A2U1QJ19_ARTAN|nr:SPIRAL1-like5 [Artemisia annua]